MDRVADNQQFIMRLLVALLNQDQKNLDSGAVEMRAETDLKEVDVE